MHWRIYERGMEFGWLFVIIFLVLAVLGIIHLINLFSGGKGPRQRGNSPLDIIKSRYAKGEITKDDFEKMKRALTDKPD